MIGLLNPYAWLAGALVVGGLYAGHTYRVSSAEKAGYGRGIAEWRKADDIAVAAGQAQTKLLARNAIIHTETLNAKLQTLEAKNNARSVALAERGLTIDQLRIELNNASSTPSDPTTCPAAREHETNLRRCQDLLSKGLGLAKGADHLAGQGEEILGVGEARLTALQEWGRLVESANEAP